MCIRDRFNYDKLLFIMINISLKLVKYVYIYIHDNSTILVLMNFNNIQYFIFLQEYIFNSKFDKITCIYNITIYLSTL